MNPDPASHLGQEGDARDRTDLVQIYLPQRERMCAVQCDKHLGSRWSCTRLFPDPLPPFPFPFPFPNEPRDAGWTAGGSQWTISGEGCPAWAGPCIRALSVCLLNHSSPGASAAPPLSPPPPGRRTRPLARRPQGCSSAQPTASGENTGGERQEDIPGQHKGPASAEGGWAHSSARQQRGL